MKHKLMEYGQFNRTAKGSLFVFVLNVTPRNEFFSVDNLESSVMTDVYHTENHRNSTKKLKLTNMEILRYLKAICLTLCIHFLLTEVEHKPGDW